MRTAKLKRLNWQKKKGEGSDEARVHKIAARPYVQTKAAMAELHQLHLAYRSLCAEYAHGRAASAHHRSGNRPCEGVTWSMDYCFLGEACGACGNEDTTDPV